MRKIKYVFALLAALLALTTAAFAAEPGDALVPVAVEKLSSKVTENIRL